MIGCATGQGATSTGTPPAQAAATSAAGTAVPTGAGPTPFPSGEVLITARVSGNRHLEGGCAWVIDANQRKWELKLPAGYRWGWDGDVPALYDAGAVIARFGDTIDLRGTLGWYSEREVIVKFTSGVLDSQIDLNGPADATVKRWAADHGLELVWPSGHHGLGWWLFYTADGTTPDQKVDQLEGLAEIDVVVKDAQGSFCMVGAGFTVTSIQVIEHAAGG